MDWNGMFWWFQFNAVHLPHVLGGRTRHGRRIGSPAGGARLSARRVGVDAAAGGDGAGWQRVAWAAGADAPRGWGGTEAELQLSSSGKWTVKVDESGPLWPFENEHGGFQLCSITR